MSAQRNTAQRRDIHAEITTKLIASIEADPGQPSMPWRRSSGPLFMPTNALTGNVYNGINIVSLWVSAELGGFTAPIWATYRQWSELGAQVRKGEKSSLVIFYKEYETDADPDNADDDGKRRVTPARLMSSTQARSTASPCRQRRNGLGRSSASKLPIVSSAPLASGSSTAASAPITAHPPTTSRCPTKDCSAAPIR
jgi:hypothetical protein